MRIKKYLNDYRVRTLIGVLLLVGIVGLLNSLYLIEQVRYSVEGPVLVEAPVVEKGEPNLITIESLGIQAPIVYVEDKSEKSYQAALAGGVVHHPDSAKIGAVGNAYLFGHSSDLPWKPGDYKTVFALLPKIETDAVIVVSDQEGVVYRYQVIETLVVESNDFAVLSQDTGGKQVLTLQTSYPVGTALRRFIVKAEIENIESSE